MNKYREVYFETVESMEESPNEIAWDCSTVAIFGVMDMFMKRLLKVIFSGYSRSFIVYILFCTEQIKHIIEVKETYSVLERIRISGMETFEMQLKTAHNKIVSKPYNMLNYR